MISTVYGSSQHHIRKRLFGFLANSFVLLVSLVESDLAFISLWGGNKASLLNSRQSTFLQFPADFLDLTMFTLDRPCNLLSHNSRLADPIFEQQYKTIESQSRRQVPGSPMSPFGSIGRSDPVSSHSDISPTRPTNLARQQSIDRRSLRKGRIPDTDKIKSTSMANSPVSQASTMKFEYCGHVPYTQFEPQVRELCHLLWPASNAEATGKPFVERIRQRLTDAFGLNDPSSAPPSPQAPKEFIIEHLRGGTFNRVVGVTAIEKDVPESRMVLRVPRRNLAEPEHDVTILQFVQEHATMIPIPEVISCDLSLKNPLNAPYVLQKRIPGFDLESRTRSYPDLTHEQKMMFVEEFCQILVDLQGIEHPYAGRIDTRVDDKGTKEFTVGPFQYGPESEELIAKRSTSMPFFKVRKYGAELAGGEAPKTSGCMSKPIHQTPFFFLMTQFGRWKYMQLELSPDCIWDTYDLADRLVTAAIQMNEMGFLDPFKDEAHSFCLTHYDLDPRNIMVDIQEDGTLKISGILDWDLAMFAPKWVHCRPPMWIWVWLDGGNEDQRKANDAPPTEEQQELKELFEDLVGWEFTHCAYHTAYRLARTLFRLALYGFQGEHAIDDAEKLLEEWEEYCKSRKSDGKNQEADERTDGDEDADDQV
jgi:aminoglycoside phosphotransferase (APT) family kinase protein